MSWISTLAFYSDNFARKVLVNEHAQALIGVYEFYVTSVNVKLLSNYNNQCGILCSNLVTSFELNSENTLEKIYQPLQLLELQGRSGTSKVFTFENPNLQQFSDISECTFWIDDLSRRKLNIELTVLFSFRKLP